MPERKAAYIDGFRTGMSVPLHIEELGHFENALTMLLPADARFREKSLAEFDLNWATRMNLVDALRGKHFSGRVVDLSVKKIEDPLGMLLSCDQTRPRFPYNKQIEDTDLVGFMVNASLQSTRKKELGMLTTPVWIVRNIYEAAHLSRRLWTRYIGQNQAENEIDLQFRQSVITAHASNGISSSTGSQKRHGPSGVDEGSGHQF